MLMTLAKQMTTLSLNCTVFKAKICRCHYNLLPGFPFIFTPDIGLPINITIDQFFGKMLVFTILDLDSGCLQIELEEYLKVRIYSRRQFLLFKRMPFGLCNTPASV